MKDYSIESFADKIISPKTKEYFKEVSSSYFNGNNRAAIVTLYSVVIFDLLYKLEELVELFEDEKASGILKSIREAQNKNPTNSDWEKDIITKIKTSTKLLDEIDAHRIDKLRKDRHLCAHPIINKETNLYTPNKEEVAAHIRNMLESVLTKPAILSKKILPTLLKDTASKKDYLINEEETEKYLKAKYLKNLTPQIEVELFKDLWKFIFFLNDEEANENRNVNFYILCILYKRNTQECSRKIDEENTFFSSKVNDAEETLRFFIKFLAIFESIYSKFKDDIKMLIGERIKKDINANIVAHFVSSSYVEHLIEIRSKIKEACWRDIKTSAEKNLINKGLIIGKFDEVVNYIIWRYTSSNCYNEADNIFETLLYPNIKNLFTKEEHFKTLYEKANTNDQVYARRKAKNDHNKLQNIIIDKFPNFDFTPYPNIK